MPTIDLTLLGGLALHVDAAPVVVKRNAVLALLVYLAVEGGPQDRSNVAGLLWPDQRDDEARNSLRQVLHQARSLPVPLIVATRQNLTLAADPTVQCDYTAVNALLAAGDWAAAVARYSGPLLGERIVWDSPLFNEWLLIQREQLHRRIMGAFTRLLEAAERGRDWPQVVQLAGRQIALDPWRESAHVSLMQALAAQGDRSAALAHYQTLERLLDSELGVAPAPATQALHAALARDAWQHAAPPAHNLPEALTGFVGRVAERAAIAEQLATPRCRWLTLVGPGGVGKSRLALEAARAQIGRFADGVWLVELAGAATLDAAIAAIADALGLTLQGNAPPARQLATALRPRGLLLLLDNVEQLLEDGLAALATELLAASAGSKLLMTSRERLDDPAEWLLPVGGLPVDESVALFVRRARHVQPNFAATPENIPALQQLAAAVDGMPLALELASGWLRMMTVAEIVAELTHNPDLLSAQKKTHPARHASIRVIFESAWQRLPVVERQVLLRLAVFAGDCSRAAAAAVAGATPLALLQLVNRSLLQVDAERRYRWHPLLLQYVRAKLVADVPIDAATRAAHARYYAELLAAAYPDLTNAQQIVTVRRLRPDEANLRAAYGWAVATAEFELVNRMSDPLLRYDQARSNLRAIVERHQTAIALCDAHALPPTAYDNLPLRLRKFFAFFAAHLGRYDEAEAAATQAATLAAAHAVHREHAVALQVLGVIADYRGQAQAAIDYMQRAIAVLEHHEVGPELHNMLLNNLAQAQLALGDYAGAEPTQRKALAFAEQVGEPHDLAIALSVLATIMGGLRRYDEALTLIARARELYTSLEDPLGLSLADRTEGEVYDELGRYAEAIALKQAAVAACRTLGFTAGLSYTLYSLGQSYRLAGQPAQARVEFDAAYASAEAAAEPAWAAAALGGLCQLLAPADPPLAANLLAALLATGDIHGSLQGKFDAALLQLVPPATAAALRSQPSHPDRDQIYAKVTAALNDITLA